MNFDIGFNPHSFGAETDFIISLCRKYSFFKLHHRGNLGLNYHDMMRDYLGLPRKVAKLRKGSAGKDCLDQAEDILICPESTEVRRTLDDAQVLAIIEQLQKENSRKITVAIASPEKYPRTMLRENISLFKLKKSKQSSRQFIKRIIESDLGICVDSAPLHLFNVFGKSNIALLSSVPPETVLDFDTQSVVIRSLNMKGVYCELTQCRQPACMNNLSQLMFDRSYNYPFVDNSGIRVEYTRCVEL